MKFLSLTVAAGLAGFSAGCTSLPSSIALEPIGPRQFPPDLPAASRGSLVVYSAFAAGNPADESDQPHHSDYELRSANGELLKKVYNREHPSSEEPATVALAPGQYSVVARAIGSRRVTVTVVIEATKTTCVRLDGSEPIGSKRAAAAELVSLPDGTPVGWRVKPGN